MCWCAACIATLLLLLSCRVAKTRQALTCDNGGLVMQQALGPDLGTGHEKIARVLTVI